jgi:predicted alpha/beta superfamily hydrolase
MRKETTIGGKQCYLYGFDEGGSGCPVAALPLLVQPADDHDLAVLDSEVAEIQRLYGAGFRLVAFKVDDWNADLSPWEAPPAFGNEPFGGKAEETLAYIENELLPALLGENSGADAPVILGGYSLAGLFALWAGTRSERFRGIAAASPSVWFPGWIEHAEKHWQSAPEGTGQSDSLKSGPQRIYLSLGDKEERTRNQQMARVGDCIRRQHEILTAAGIANTLVWEQGNHFKEPDLRTARAFAWVMGGMR